MSKGSDDQAARIRDLEANLLIEGRLRVKLEAEAKRLKSENKLMREHGKVMLDENRDAAKMVQRLREALGKIMDEDVGDWDNDRDAIIAAMSRIARNALEGADA